MKKEEFNRYHLAYVLKHAGLSIETELSSLVGKQFMFFPDQSVVKGRWGDLICGTITGVSYSDIHYTIILSVTPIYLPYTGGFMFVNNIVYSSSWAINVSSYDQMELEKTMGSYNIGKIKILEKLEQPWYEKIFNRIKK